MSNISRMREDDSRSMDTFINAHSLSHPPILDLSVIHGQNKEQIERKAESMHLE